MTAVVLVAVPAVIAKVAFDAPTGMVTWTGTESSADELVNATEIPPVGAAPLKLTVPVPVRPLTMTVGVADKSRSAGGVTDNVADAERFGPLAVMRTDVVALTTVVVTAKVALELPATTVTLPGTEATAEFADWSVTINPPAGAALSSWTVAVELFPPTTDAGESERDATSAASVAAGDQETIEAMSVSSNAMRFMGLVPLCPGIADAGTCPFGYLDRRDLC